MEETDLEEGEACYYQNNNNNDDDDDDNSSLDPDVALSYIDEKLQDVLGHFQKDFEGGVSAENLGAKFGGYGSFLPSYQRSPASSHPRTPPKVHNYSGSRSPNNLHLEGGHQSSLVQSTASVSARFGQASVNGVPLPAVKAPSVNDSVKQDVCLLSTNAEAKYANPLDQKNLKVQIQMSSNNPLTRKNAEIYSGLGLDVSPSSSLDGSPTDSDGLSHEPLDAPYESPTSILQIMASLPAHWSLPLSPLPNDVIRLIKKAKLRGVSRSGSMHKKPKPSEKYVISRDLRNDYVNDARNSIDVLLKKETDIDTLACEEIVFNALRLPLLSNSYCNTVDSAKGNASDIDTSSFARKEEPLEPVSTQENGLVEKPTDQVGSDRKVLENKKASTDDDNPAYERKGVGGKGGKTDIQASGDSNASKGRKALEAELIDPPKLKAGQKATSNEEDGIKVGPGKEHSSSGGQKKSKGSKNKSEVENVRKDYGKATDRYKDFFGDLESEEQGDCAKVSDEMVYIDSLKHSTVSENVFEFKGASRERSNVKKIERSSTSEEYPRTGSNVASLTGNVPISSATGAVPPVVKEDWVCCDKCQKWRLLPLGTNPDSLPEKWLCSMLNWLPGFNRCNISEEETTKAVMTRFQVPAPAQAPLSQSSQHNHAGGILLGVSSADARNSDQNQQDLGLHVLPGGKKKHELKDVSNVNNQDGPQFSNSMKKNLQASVVSRSVNGENHSPTVNEKKKLLENHSGGGDSHNSKMRNKRETDQDSVGASKKIKTYELEYSDEDRTPDHGGDILMAGQSANSGLSINVSEKNKPHYNDLAKDSKHHSKISVRNPEDQMQIASDDGLLHMAKHDDRDVVKKRKGNECQDTQIYTVPLPSSGNQFQDNRDFMEETSENDHRREKKARVSKSGGEDMSTSKGSGGTDKKGTIMMDKQLRPDLGSTPSQQSVDAIGYLKRDMGSVQLAMAATSSSSKVSSSHKDKANPQEVKGSPVESVSSSPLRISNATYLVTDAAANTIGQVAQYPCEPQASDPCPAEERGNDNQYHADGSHPSKSGKGSSSRSKDKSKSARSEFGKSNLKTSDSINESIDHTPYDEKSKAGRKQINFDRGEKSLVSKKDSTGKLFAESGKRESQPKFGQHDGSDVKIDAIFKQELKPDLDRDGEKSSKRVPSDKIDRVHGSVRGKSHSLPPSGKVPSETLRWPQSISGFQKENRTNALSVDASEGDDPLKALKQVKKAENQNGNQAINSKHPLPNGVKVKRDIDAPSPVRRDSSNQAASNAVKEAKDLKHLADRLKNSGSNAESTGIYFQAALKFLHGASLLESCNSENSKHGELIQSMQMYSSTAKLCEFCAHEYEKSKDMAAAALAYKCTEVAYLRVIYSSHASASRDQNELQTALQIVPSGESPSSSASDIENLNHPVTAEKAALAKGVSSPHVAGNHVIAARNRPNFVRLLNFAQDVNFAMEASRKSRISFSAASPKLEEVKCREGISSVKKALDFNFQDVEGLLHMVRVAMEIISR
ncbi:hypothetical protein LguiA_020313 [Lonicera macranthoides]